MATKPEEKVLSAPDAKAEADSLMATTFAFLRELISGGARIEAVTTFKRDADGNGETTTRTFGVKRGS